MGYLKFLGISILLLYTSVNASTVVSTSKKDLERAAELAVERAAEKAAERAVEKALNSGNSSTITVTVKESYSNAKKTAEEAAAPGSESTRPYDPNIYDRQYSHNPNAPDGYKVISSQEEEEEEEAMNEKGYEPNRSFESKTSAEMSIESAALARAPISTPIKSPIKNFDPAEPEVDFADFDSLDISSDASFQGNFGLKSNSGRTKTFSRSYASDKPGFPDTKVEVDDHEDAEIFKMYAKRLGKDGWSSTKEKGWVRHRPLWDDNKSTVDRHFWSDFPDMSTSETKFERDKSKRNNERMHKPDQFTSPSTKLSVNANPPLPFYQLLNPPLVHDMPLPGTYSFRGRADGPQGPVKLYITIPVTYPPTHGKDKDLMTTESPKHLKKQLSERGPFSPKQVLKRSYGLESGLLVVAEKNSHPQNKRQTRLKNHMYPSMIQLPPSNLQFYNSKFFQRSYLK